MLKLLFFLTLAVSPALGEGKLTQSPKANFRDGAGATVVPFAPTDIASLAIWWDAFYSDITKDGANLVAQWNNKASATDNHASQSIDSRKPLYVANQLSGKPIIRLDNSDDRLEVSTTTALFVVGRPFTLYFLVKGTVPGANWYCDWFNFAPNIRMMRTSDTGYGDLGFGIGGSGIIRSGGGNTFGNAWKKVKISYNGGAALTLSSWEFQFNGVVVNTLAVGGDAGGGQTQIGFGGGSAFGGDLAFVQWFNSTLSPSETLNLETWQLTEWGY